MALRTSSRNRQPPQRFIDPEQQQLEQAAAHGLVSAQIPRVPVEIPVASPVANADPEVVKRLSRYLNEDLTSTSSPTAIAVRMWGPEAVALFLDQRDAVRYMYSPTNNDSQCIRAGLGNPNNPE